MEAIGAPAQSDSRVAQEGVQGAHNHKVRGPKGGHNGQRSAVASRIFKSFLAEMGIRQQFTAPQDNNQDYVCAVRRTGPEKLGREVAGDYASSQHEQIGIHRPYTGVSHPGQETASTQQSM